MKNNQNNGLSKEEYKGHSIHELLVAIWAKCNGDYQKMVSFLTTKEKISAQEIGCLAEEQESLVKEVRGRIVTMVDDDYPEEYKSKDNPPICYIQIGRKILATPLSGNKRHYYIEFCLRGISLDSDHDYLVQSKWFSTREEALAWYKGNFDYVDSKFVSAYLMTAEFYSEEDYDIVGSEKLENI